MSRTYRLERRQIVRRPLDEVFGFFAEPENLERLTPDLLRFSIVTPGPIPMAPGTLIEYRLRLYGIPFRWLTRIELYEPGVRFVDVQLKGPYRSWRHLHEFKAVPGGTEVRDTVDYSIAFGPLGSIARAVLVRRSLDRIFEFRMRKIAELLDGSKQPAPFRSPSPS